MDYSHIRQNGFIMSRISQLSSLAGDTYRRYIEVCNLLKRERAQSVPGLQTLATRATSRSLIPSSLKRQ